jgi:hypothetical protein
VHSSVQDIERVGAVMGVVVVVALVLGVGAARAMWPDETDN